MIKRGYLRGVGTDSELAREAWGGTLTERPVSAMGKQRLIFLKMNENVKLGQHEGFLYHGPAFRSTAAGQPLKIKVAEIIEPYIHYSYTVNK